MYRFRQASISSAHHSDPPYRTYPPGPGPPADARHGPPAARKTLLTVQQRDALHDPRHRARCHDAFSHHLHVHVLVETATTEEDDG